MGMSLTEWMPKFTTDTSRCIFFTSAIIPTLDMALIMINALSKGFLRFIMPARNTKLLGEALIGEMSILFYEKASVKLSVSGETLPLMFFSLLNTDVLPLIM
jgi:hypothetical protein